MWKLLKTINFKSQGKGSRFLRIIITCLVATILALPIMEVLSKKEATRAVDINAGVKSALDPLIKAINDHWWGKIIILVICGSAVIGEGGFMTRCVTFNKRKDKGSRK